MESPVSQSGSIDLSVSANLTVDDPNAACQPGLYLYIPQARRLPPQGVQEISPSTLPNHRHSVNEKPLCPADEQNLGCVPNMYASPSISNRIYPLT